jgi:hypothetical protein
LRIAIVLERVIFGFNLHTFLGCGL